MFYLNHSVNIGTNIDEHMVWEMTNIDHSCLLSSLSSEVLQGPPEHTVLKTPSGVVLAT